MTLVVTLRNVIFFDTVELSVSTFGRSVFNSVNHYFPNDQCMML